MRSRTIMIVDDEPSIQRVIARVLNGPSRVVIAAGDGERALALAAELRPDLIVLDVNMPGKDGWEVLGELRRRTDTRMKPVIILTSAGAIADKVGGLELGADDFMTKPFAAPELLARVDGLIRRHEQAVAANPLTGLPGNHAIEAEVSRRLREGTPFAFFYIDIDRFKAFNDACGFAQGDRLLLNTARLIEMVFDDGFGDGFVGHIGGDDFVAISGLKEAPHAGQALARLFDEAMADAVAPPPTLSIGIVTTQWREFSCYAEVASEMKSYLKSDTRRKLSRFAFDRRSP